MDKIKLTIDGYNKIAKHWDGTRRHGWSEVYQYIDINILKFLIERNITSKKIVNILDLGCGNGRLIDFLKSRYYFNNLKYVGVDPSKELINICIDRYTSGGNKIKDNLEFKINDGLYIPLCDDSIDIIISLAVLHHLPTNYQNEWLMEVYRVIKKTKESKIILTVWIQDDKSYRQEETLAKSVHKKISDNEMMMGFAQYKNIRYIYLFTENEIHDLLAKNNFKILESHTDKRPNSSHKNLILVLEPMY